MRRFANLVNLMNNNLTISRDTCFCISNRVACESFEYRQRDKNAKSDIFYIFDIFADNNTE